MSEAMSMKEYLPDLAFGEANARKSFDARAMTEMLSAGFPGMTIIEPLNHHDKKSGFLNKSCDVTIGGLNILATASTPCLYDLGENTSVTQITIPFYGEAEICVENEKYQISAHKAGSVLGHYRRAVGFNAATNCMVLSTSPTTLNEVAKGMLNIEDPNEDILDLKKTRELNLTGSGYSVSAYLLALGRLIDDLTCFPRILSNTGIDDLFYRQLVVLLAPERFREESEQQSDGKLDQAFDLICDASLGRLDQPLTMTEMERLSGLGTKTFAKQFRLRFGCSPMEWQRQERLSIARERLRGGEKVISIAQLSADLGFTSAKSFLLHYKKRYGENPEDTLHNRYLLRSAFRNYLRSSNIEHAC